MDKKCVICGSTEGIIQKYKGEYYCRKHYMQMYRHCKILNRTIYDPNEIVEKENYAVIYLYNKKGKYKGETKIDKEDVSRCSEIKWYMRINGDNIYAYGKIKGKTIMLHRYLLGITNPQIVVDHINHNGLDNRKSNLRPCTHKQNIRNMSKEKVIGVNFDKERNKWVANITVNGKNLYLGRYIEYKDAVDARLKAEKKYFKEFAPQAK